MLFDNHVSARKFKYTKVDRKFILLLRKVQLLTWNLEFAHQNEYSAKVEEGVEHLEVPSKN